jgi:hypothetical protein
MFAPSRGQIASGTLTIPDGTTTIRIVGSNKITELSSIPSSVTDIFCINTGLTTLPPLPPNLTRLICDMNKLESLPELPSSLVELSCRGNNLQSLPSLPNALEQLNCDYNNLTTLPSLPSSLVTLDCHNNKLVSLPPLPPNLRSIRCFNNLLTRIPDLPLSILSVNFTNNPLLPSWRDALNNYVNKHHSIDNLREALKTINKSYSKVRNIHEMRKVNLLGKHVFGRSLEGMTPLVEHLIGSTKDRYITPKSNINYNKIINNYNKLYFDTKLKALQSNDGLTENVQMKLNEYHKTGLNAMKAKDKYEAKHSMTLNKELKAYPLSVPLNQRYKEGGRQTRKGKKSRSRKTRKLN